MRESCQTGGVPSAHVQPQTHQRQIIASFYRISSLIPPFFRPSPIRAIANGPGVWLITRTWPGGEGGFSCPHLRVFKQNTLAKQRKGQTTMFPFTRLRTRKTTQRINAGRVPVAVACGFETLEDRQL